MPGLHSPIDKPLFIYKGLVKTDGASGNLAKGQFAIVTDKPVAGGLKVVSDFAGLPKDAPIKFMVGRHKLPSDLRSPYAPNYSTSWFTSKDIVSIKANFPKHTKRTFDEVLIGYDGVNADSAIDLAEGQTTVLDVILSGKPIEVFSRSKGCDYPVKIHFGRKVGETNQEAVRRAVKQLQDFKLPANKKLTDLVDIKIVDSSNENLTGIPYVFSKLTLVDAGDANSLALVQAQYPYLVVKTNRNEALGTTEYTILHPVSASLSAYSKTVIDASVKDCANCAVGYTEIDGGVVYHINLEDDGTDQTALIEALPGYVTGTVVKAGVKDGVGSYTAILDNALTDAEIASFIAAGDRQSTAELKYLGTLADVCSKSTTTTTAWVDGQVCYASVEQYSIQLKDNDCGASRLAELQKFYPNLVIEEGLPTGMATQTVTLSGSSGNAVINIAGVAYTEAYSSNSTTTAANFVTNHAAAILDSTGAEVTSSGAVITITDKAEGFPTVTATAGGLVETVGTIDYLTTATTGGCQRVYSTYVVTDIVCDECSDIFLQPFKSEAPVGYDFTEWVKKEFTSDANAKMGILIKGKPFDLVPYDIVRDEIPFYETSVDIKVAGGYLEAEYENFQPVYSDIFKVVRLSRKQDRDALGFNFLGWEEVSRAHYLGENRMEGNAFARGNFGDESVIDLRSQYVTYEVTFDDNKYSQGVGGRSQIGHSVMLVAEFGYHTQLETLLNTLASKAGVDTVNPTAN